MNTETIKKTYFQIGTVHVYDPQQNNKICDYGDLYRKGGSYWIVGSKGKCYVAHYRGIEVTSDNEHIECYDVKYGHTWSRIAKLV